jgi:hypothetical protein
MAEATAPKETKPETVDIKSMNIFQRMAAITDELGVVAKNLSVKAGGGSYKAVSERDIIDAVKPLETKYRVYSFPSHREILESETLENEKEYQGKITKSTTFFTRVQTEYTFINIDKPEERFSTIVFSEGIDPGDKGSGKAMTYADKYALMKAYKISTGDDPDQNPSEENRYTRTGNGQNRNQHQGNNQYHGNNQGQSYGNRGYQGPANPQPQQAAPGIKVQCKNCGKIITDSKRKDGTWMTASEVAFYSSQRYGVTYCAECMTLLENQRNGQQ